LWIEQIPYKGRPSEVTEAQDSTILAGDPAPIPPPEEGQAPPLRQQALAPSPAPPGKGRIHLVIEPRSGWSALHLLELWQYRDLLLTLAGRDVKLRYKQTALGVIWVILQPLLAAAIFAFVFGKVAKLPSDGLPYFLFAYAGLLGWNAFNSTLTKASACVVDNSQLVSKVFFPRLILPLSTVFSTLIDFAVALIFMAVMMVFYGITPTLGILLVPLWLLMLIMLAVGVGLYTSALMVPYRDLRYVIPVLMQFLLYASPVAYSVSVVPQNLRPWFYLNPICGLLEAFRWSLLGCGQLNWGLVAYSAGCVVVAFLFGAYSFKKMERRFADVI
jgi:lipopolysaccharide transport system permease protein